MKDRGRLAVSAALAGLLLIAAAGACGEETGPGSDASDPSERALAEEIEALRAEYRQIDQELRRVNDYNRDLTRWLGPQGNPFDLSAEERARVPALLRRVPSMLEKMVDRLERHVEGDVPFYLEERRQRIQELRGALADGKLVPAEKYRRVLEAYEIEVLYARTVESYERKIETDTGARTVKILRVGNIALVYQTPDASETGYWNADEKRWVVDDSYREAVTRGIRIAERKQLPDLLVVPVRAPRASQVQP
jgi:hypothetical protein